MNKTQVMDLLKSNTNDRGVENWNKLDISKKLKSFGIGRCGRTRGGTLGQQR